MERAVEGEAREGGRRVNLEREGQEKGERLERERKKDSNHHV